MVTEEEALSLFLSMIKGKARNQLSNALISKALILKEAQQITHFRARIVIGWGSKLKLPSASLARAESLGYFRYKITLKVQHSAPPPRVRVIHVSND